MMSRSRQRFSGVYISGAFFRLIWQIDVSCPFLAASMATRAQPPMGHTGTILFNDRCGAVPAKTDLYVYGLVELRRRARV